jgi:hypothetical protein
MAEEVVAMGTTFAVLELGFGFIELFVFTSASSRCNVLTEV